MPIRYRTRKLHTSFHLKFLDTHPVAAGHFDIVAPAAWTCFIERGQREVLPAFLAPPLPCHLDDFQPCPTRDTAARHPLEAETQGFLFHTSQLADFQPHRLDPRVSLLVRRI